MRGVDWRTVARAAQTMDTYCDIFGTLISCKPLMIRLRLLGGGGTWSTQMKKLLVALASIAAIVSAASAADLGVRPYTSAPAPAIAAIYNWSGFYIGINGGGGSGDVRFGSDSTVF